MSPLRPPHQAIVACFASLVAALLLPRPLSADELTRLQLATDFAAIEALRDADRHADGAPVEHFAQRYPAGVFEDQADRHLRRMQVLDLHHDVQISDLELQRELDRMARTTRRPEQLRRFFAALDGDPRRIAEALARPQLIDRRLRNLYRQQTRSEDPGAASFEAWLAAQSVDGVTLSNAVGDLRLPDIIGSGTDEPDSWSRELPEAPDAKQGQSAIWTGSELLVWGGRVPGGPASGLWTNAGFSYDPVTDQWSQLRLDDTTPEPRAFHSAVWTGSAMIVWGGETWDETGSPPYYTVLDNGGVYDPVEDRWTATPTDGAPSPRMEHVAVWTGNEMVVWGGLVPDAGGLMPPPIVPDYQPLDTGARYDPAFGGWTAMGGTPPTARGRAAAVWTGDILHLIGGFDGSQWLDPQSDGSTFSSYNPSTDDWDIGLPQPPSGGPMAPPFEAPQAVWTGESLWVAQPASGRLLAQYRFGVWSEPSPPPGSTDLRYESLVWTGRRLILWGGQEGMPGMETVRNRGLIYDAQTSLWSRIVPNPPTSPSGRFGHFGFWTGSEMLIWGGGQNPDPNAGSSRIFDLVSDGGRYSPSWSANIDGGSWRSMPLPPLAAAERSSMVWTGAELLIWGGFDIEAVERGARYDPALDVWSSLSRLGVAAARFDHSTVWSGSEMIVWGGFDSTGNPLDSGGRYDPVTDTWQATGGTPPSPRGRHTAVWTGGEMIVWGGHDNAEPSVAGSFASGGRYEPVGDTWQATGGTPPSPRGDHSAVWTGQEMLVFGGLSGCPACQVSNQAAVYDPLSDLWSAPFSPPSGGERWAHSAVWAGDRMVVWGGTATYEDSNACLADGLMIDPDASSSALLPAEGTPRCRHSAVWNGVEMIVWGGSDRVNVNLEAALPPEIPTASGARFDLASGTWTTTPEGSFSPAAVQQHRAVWTGEEMFLWGGQPRISSNLGVYYTDTLPTASPKIEVDGLPGTMVLLGGDAETIRFDHTLTTAYFDDVEGEAQWTAEGPTSFGDSSGWHVSVAGSCASQGDYASPLSAWRFGVPGTCSYSGATGTYRLTSNNSFVITDATLLELRYLLETDAVGNPGEQDVARIEVSADDGASWTTVAIDLTHHTAAVGGGPPAAVPLDDRGGSWRGLSIALSPYVGTSSEARVRFAFERQGTLNGRIGWLIDDIGIGEPAGDGRLASGSLVASDGSVAQHRVANHELWDRPHFAWDLNADGTPDNDEGDRPSFEIDENDLATYGLDQPGLHDVELTVSDRNGNRQQAVVGLEVVDGQPPSVQVLTPNGGEAWPAGSTRLITWSAEDNIGLAGFDVAWFDDEAATGPHEILCEEPLDGDSRACTWTLPEITSTAARLQVTARDQRPEPGGPNTASDGSDAPFYLVQANSDAIRTLVVWHSGRIEAIYGGAEKDTLGAALANYAAQVKVDGQVLDLANVPSLAPLYDTWDGTQWDAGSSADLDDNIVQANVLAEAIRLYLFEQVAQSFTNLEYLVLVGGDPLIPMWRQAEDLPRYPESNYIGELQSFGLLDDASSAAAFCDETESPVMGAMCRDHYLADAPYGASFATAVPGSSFTWFLPDIALGRLVETPEQIRGLIDVFIAQDGVTIVDRALTSGYDFLTDGGDAIQGRLVEELDLDVTTVDRLSQSVSLWDDDDLLAPLFGNPPALASDLSFVVGHADHRAEGAAQIGEAGVLTTLEMVASGLSNRGAVVVGVGCHSALPVQADGGASDETAAAFLLDLPEVMAESSFPVFIGNGGYGWALSEGVGLGEQLLLLISDEILRAGQVTVGEALRLAKQEYFLRQDRLDAFDHKVIHEAMLFGFPNYEVRVELAADSEAAGQSSWALLAGPRAERDAIRAAGPRVPGRPWLGDPDWQQWRLPSGGLLSKSPPRLVDRSSGHLGGANLQVLDFSFQAFEAGQDTDGNPQTADWQEAYEQFDWCTDLEGESLLCTGDPDETPVGTFFTLNRLASNEAGRPIQPMISFDSRLFGTELHGILIRGGEVLQPAEINPLDASRCTDVFGTVHPCFDPVVGNPESEVDESEGPAPTPFVNIDSPTPFVNIDSPTSNGFFENGAGGPIRFDTLNAPMGTSIRRGVREDELMQRREIFSQWLYRTRDFTNYYSNSTDWAPPTIGAYTADCSDDLPGDDCFHTLEGAEVTFNVPVTDEGEGVFRVFITYTGDVDSAGNGAWITLPLEPMGGDLFGAPLTVDRTSYYLIQAVDWAGNVGSVVVSGQDVDADGAPIGSAFELPQLFTIQWTVEGPPPLFADGFESGDDGQWDAAVP